MAQRFLARQTLLRHPQGIATAMCTTRRSAVRSNTVISQSSSSSSSSALSSYAMVSHAKEYSEAMSGRHGKQLDLAWKEGSMKHDRNQPFDPFAHYKVNDDVDDDVDDNDNNNNNEEEEEIVGDMKDMNEQKEDSSERNGDSDTLTATLDAIQYTYTNDGSLSMPHSTRAAHIAGAPAGGAFAVISLGNTGIQHKVTIHDVITSNKLKPVDAWAVGTTHTIGIGIGESDADNSDANGDADNSDANAAGQVLLVGDSNRTCVGLPFVQGAQVDVMVEEITRDQTVIVFKKKRRKNHRRKNGFRREVTFLRVLDIRFPAVHHAKEEEREEGTRGTLVDDVMIA